MDDPTILRSAKNLSVVMRLLYERTQIRVAAAIGLSDSALGEWITKKHLERACAVIAAAGGKVVNEGDILMDKKAIASLYYFAEIGMRLSSEQHSDFGQLDVTL